MGAGKIVKLTWADGPEQTTETVTGFNEVGQTAWREYTPSISGFGTVTKNKGYWRRNGPDILIRGQFTTGTPQSSTAKMSLPEGLNAIYDIGFDNIDGYPLEYAGRLLGNVSGNYGSVLSSISKNELFFGIVSGTLGPDPFSSTDGNFLATVSGQVYSYSVRIPLKRFVV